MADITFECPECKEGLTVDAKNAGRMVNCPKCSKKILIPAARVKDEGNTAGQDELFVSLNGLSTEELISIWVAHDRKERRDEAFDVIKNILISRSVPVTTPGQPVTYKQRTYGPAVVEAKAKSQHIIGEVIVTDVRMRFWSMVFFMVKWVVASIPAMIILFLIVLALMLIMGGCLAGCLTGIAGIGAKALH